MANIKFAGEAAVGALANYIKAKLTIASSMPSSPDTNTIVLYVGATTSSYTQGGIYQYDGTNQKIINSVQAIELTQSQYNLLPTTTKNNGTIYFITDGSSNIDGSVIYGYYNTIDEKFYEESTYTTEITGEINKFYLDISTDKIYYQNTTSNSFIAITSSSTDTTYSLSVGTGDDANKIVLTPSSGTADKITVPYATSAGSAPASDVYAWAKASTKPSYTASEVGAVATTAVGSANGVAELDSTGKVPSSQLPSYVDDVLEYDSTSQFPATGEDGKIYIAKDTNKTYRWSGTTYVEISESLALGETSSTAYAGNKGKANADAIAAIKDGTNIDSFSDVETALDEKANVERKSEYGDTWSAKTWSGLSSFYGAYTWSDGTDIYYSYNSDQYVLNKSTSTWSTKTWSGLSSFRSSFIWSDGTDTYYSNSSDQYVLNKSTSTWTAKTWSGLSSFYGTYIWTDGDNIYYSSGSDQYVLNKSTSTWTTKTWLGFSNLFKDSIWSDGDNIYYSSGSSQYVLDKSTSTWSTKTWSELTSFNGSQIWSDGDNTYYSNSSDQYVLDKSTSTWNVKTWSGLTSFLGGQIWSDGDNIYYSSSSSQYVLSKTEETTIENSIIVKPNGDLQGAAEIYDNAGNALSDKYDATSLTFPNERFTITASSWSNTQTGGYYTYTLNTGTTKYNTYCPVFMDKTGVNDSTDPTAAEAAAYALVDKFDMADGTGVNSFTLYAKTKPTTTFYIKLSGQYMAKNAASSTKALDITTGCKLTLGDALGNTYEFDGSTERTYIKRNIGILVSSSNWTSTVDASGYYTNTIDLGYGFNVYNDPRIRPYPTGNNNEVTAAEGAAYNLVDVWYMADGTNVSQLVAKAKTKPTTTFKIRVVGDSMS